MLTSDWPISQVPNSNSLQFNSLVETFDLTYVHTSYDWLSFHKFWRRLYFPLLFFITPLQTMQTNITEHEPRNFATVDCKAFLFSDKNVARVKSND